MNKAEYITIISEAMKYAGTDKPQYYIARDTLADILEKRDEVQELYNKEGKPIINHTNKAGATNLTQSPILRLLNDCNKTALTYLKELGLTPGALKKINAKEATETKKENKLQALQAILDKEGETPGNEQDY